VSPDSRNVKEDGDSTSVNVKASAASCTWTATSGVAWITVTGGRNRTGDDRVEFTVAANSSSTERTGTLTLAGKSVTVTQDSHRRRDDERVEGYVRDLQGSCPSRSFVVDVRLLIVTIDRRNVRTDAQTDFRDGGCGQIDQGTRVSIRGELQPDGSILASRVDIQRGLLDGEAQEGVR
jgi:hypothetical protein